MRALTIIVACAVLLGLNAKAASEVPDRVLVSEARAAADLLQKRLREMSKSLASREPVRAVAGRKYSMPEIASSVSRQTGWKIALVSLTPRNPALATPDAWERAALTQFPARLKSGEKPERLEHYEIITEGSVRYFRYMRAIVLSKECIACHGDTVAPEVKAQLAVDYPHDRSSNAKVGDVRGAVSVKRPL